MDSNMISMIGMLFIPAGLMIILGLLLYRKSKKAVEACKAEVNGEVDSYKTKNGMLVPIVRYTVSGSRFYADLRIDDATKKDYPIGKKIQVHYNPRKPQTGYAGDDPYISAAGLMLVAAGAVFACIALVILLTI